jgi:hypothetical protein
MANGTLAKATGKTKLVPKNSTFEKSKKESLLEASKKTAKNTRSRKRIVRPGQRSIKSNGSKQWEKLAIHIANTVAIGVIGIVFHVLQAPSEVTFIIYFIDVIYVVRFYDK